MKEKTRPQEYAGKEIKGIDGKTYQSVEGNHTLTNTNPCAGCVNDGKDDDDKPFKCDEVYCYGVIWKEVRQ